MTKFILSLAAEADIAAILAWSQSEFGEQARLRYEALLTQSILDIAVNPERLGVTKRDEVCEGAFTYHLWHSRLNVSESAGRVSKPRHFLLFRQTAGGTEIGRVLHDSMDLQQHLPAGYSDES